jgi:DNA repair and recombination RAD54-like protein
LQVYQRQISKEGLQKVVDKEQKDGKAQVNDISTEDLRDLFTLRKDTRSDTHETLGCNRCDAETEPTSEDVTADDGAPKEKDECRDIGRFAEVAGVLDKLRPWEKQIGTPLEEDLKSWAHHADASTVPDALLQIAACG